MTSSDTCQPCFNSKGDIPDVIPAAPSMNPGDITTSNVMTVDKGVSGEPPLEDSPPPSYTECVSHEYVFQSSPTKVKDSRIEETVVLIEGMAQQDSKTVSVPDVVLKTETSKNGSHSKPWCNLSSAPRATLCDKLKSVGRSENITSRCLYMLLMTCLALLALFVVLILPGLICYLAYTYSQSDVINGTLTFLVGVYYTFLLSCCAGSKQNK